MEMRVACTLALLLSWSIRTTGQQISGRVMDKKSGDPVPGCTIFIPDLKTGCNTDEDGRYSMKNLPRGAFLVQFRSIGYTSVTRTIDFSLTNSIDIQLEPRILEAGEVIIAGTAFSSDAERMSAPVSSIGRLQLQSIAAPNLSQALTKIPGVASLSTGAGIGKPVIRGLGLNRVVTVNQGIRQEGQQWGEEHGLEIDQFAADRIEVIKGPSSLQYGSDALGGIVHILEPITPAPGEMRGEVNSQFSSNNRLWGSSVMAEGNLSGWVARIRSSWKSAATFKTPTERVYNSGFDELAQSLMVGANKRWGYSHLQFNHWQSELGLTEGERNTDGEFIDTDGQPIPDNIIDSRVIQPPSQKIEHTKLSSTNNLILGKSQLRINAGWQLNTRREFEEVPDAATIWMQLRTFTTDIRYYPSLGKGWESAIGVSTMLQQNSNMGQEYLIPDYNQQDGGAFMTVKKNLEKMTIDGGIRLDRRRLDWSTTVSAGDTLFKGAVRDFHAISGSAGLTYALSDRTALKASVGRGFRAPSASELTADGLHEGTFRYEIGEKDLNPETSLQFDLGWNLESEFFSLDLSAFSNTVNHYIYYRNLNGETTIADNDTFLVYRYTQGKARLQGGEFALDIHPFKNLHFENTFAMVVSENLTINTPLPFTPPFRTTHSLSYEWLPNPKTKIRFSVEAENNFAQKRIDIFETVTEGYVLINALFGLDLKTGSNSAAIFLRGDNLLDKAYFNNMSRYKQIGVMGIGRNLSIGVQLPFGRSLR